MADINYKSTYGKDNWVSQTEFDSLDLSVQEEGTVYEIVGEVGGSDLDADLQAKIDAKMDAPTTSGKNGQVLTMAASGKPYWRTPDYAVHEVIRHCVRFAMDDASKVIWFWVDTTEVDAGEIQSLNDLVYSICKDQRDSLDEFFYPCTGRWGESTDNIVVTGCLFVGISSDNPTIKLYLSNGSVTSPMTSDNFESISDIPIGNI